MERYRKRSDEQVLMKGPFQYRQGEMKFKALLTGKSKITDCKTYLTTQRLVFCKSRRWNTIGALFLLISVFIPLKILFEIALGDLAAIQFDEEKRSDDLTLKTTDGSEFVVQWDSVRSWSLGSRKDKWVEAIKGAVAAAVPDVEIITTERAVEFNRRGAAIPALDDSSALSAQASDLAVS
jgi:hypothetical protein